jgi:hypothetical protein
MEQVADMAVLVEEGQETLVLGAAIQDLVDLALLEQAEGLMEAAGPVEPEATAEVQAQMHHLLLPLLLRRRLLMMLKLTLTVILATTKQNHRQSQRTLMIVKYEGVGYWLVD